MAMEPLLSFSSELAYRALSELFTKVINDLCQVILENARVNLKGEYPDVETTLQSRLLTLVSDGLIEGQVGTSHWRAFIAEWGSGSEMDTSNPDLEGYMGSELWNPLRSGTTIVGRPAGDYMGLDGQIHHSEGRMAGRYMEHFIDADEPLHFMRDALESNRNLIIDQLNAVIETFNFGDFFV